MIPESCIDRFLKKLKFIDGASNDTINSYKSSINKFNKFLEEYGIEWENIDTKTVEEFIIWLGEQGYSKNAIARHYYAIKKFLKYFEKPIKWDEVKVKREQKYEYNILTEEEVFNIIRHAMKIKPKYGLMLWLGYEGGLRASELCKLKIKNLDLQKCSLHYVPEKGGEPKNVPLSRDLCEALAIWIEENGLDSEDFLFTTKFGKPYRRDVFTKYIFDPIVVELGYVDENGKPTIRYHDFARHSRATNLLKKGVDIYTVNKIMGHKLLQTTLIYLHLAQAEELRERIEKAEGNNR